MSTTRLNISIPKDTVIRLRKAAPKRGLSKFLVEAAEEKMKKIKQDEAFKRLLAAPPAFTDIKDPVAYIKKMRRLDEKRLERLGV